MKFPTKEEIMKSRGKSLTPEQKREIGRRNIMIGELRRQGMSKAELAKMFNLSQEYIKEIYHKQGVYGPQPQKKRKMRQQSLF